MCDTRGQTKYELFGEMEPVRKRITRLPFLSRRIAVPATSIVNVRKTGNHPLYHGKKRMGGQGMFSNGRMTMHDPRPKQRAHKRTVQGPHNVPSSHCQPRARRQFPSNRPGGKLRPLGGRRKVKVRALLFFFCACCVCLLKPGLRRFGYACRLVVTGLCLVVR